MNVINSIIVPFVAKYDMPFDYDDAVGKLWESGCFAHTPSSSSTIQELAEFVGASYCSIVRADVYCLFAEGLQQVRRSRDAAEILEKRIRKQDDTKLRYILARWHDARGRISYRSGNYTLARIAFDKSLKLIRSTLKKPPSSAALSVCWADIVSNRIRADFEIARQVDAHAKKAGTSRDHLDAVVPASERLLKRARGQTARSELARGLANLLHNWLTCIHERNRPSDSERAVYKGKLESVFNEFHDVYRSDQLINADAWAAKTRKDLSAAKELYQKLADATWPRGRFFAAQHLADLSKKWKELLDLCQQVDVDANANGGIDAVDLDRFHWTLAMAEKHTPQNDRDAVKSLNYFQSAITRAVSSIVSVATYRQKFEEYIRPRLRKLIQARIRSYETSVSSLQRDRRKLANQQLDDVADELENYGAKEVLEVLRVASRESGDEVSDVDITKFVVKVPVKRRSTLKKRKQLLTAGNRPIPPRLAIARTDDKVREMIAAEVGKIRTSDEQYWLDHPLVIRELTTSTSQRARQRSLADPGQLYLRFEKLSSSDVVAFWWFHGEAGIEHLKKAATDSQRLQDATTTARKEPTNTFLHYLIEGTDEYENTGIPTPEMARRLWRSFLGPCVSKATRSSKELAIKRVTIALGAELYHVPLHLAWVPSRCRGFRRSSAPLGMCCPVEFTLNLTAHLVDGREGFRKCMKQKGDDLWVLMHDDEFDAEAAELKALFRRWSPKSMRRYADSHGRPLQFSARQRDLRRVFNDRPEFVMFACHGETDKEIGPMLHLHGITLLSFQMSQTFAFRGNKLTILGACESATPNSDEYGRFIGAFVAASAGAIMANPCSAFIPTVCRVAAGVLSDIESSKKPIDIAERLMQRAREQVRTYRRQTESEDEAMMWSGTYQLWL
jgi:hypothetical protein